MSEHLGERLTPLVDGQLGHNDRDRALSHLTRCAQCQAEVAEQRTLKARLVALAEPTLPNDLAAALLSLGALEYQASQARSAAAPSRSQPSARSVVRVPAMASGFVAGSPSSRSEAASARLADPPPPPPPPPRAADTAKRQTGPTTATEEPTTATEEQWLPGAVEARPARGRLTAAVRPGGGVLRLPVGASLRAGGCAVPAIGGPGYGSGSGSAGSTHSTAGSTHSTIRLTHDTSGAARHADAPGRRPGPAAWPGGRIRMRRTLVGSAAFMLLAVSGSALADGRAASGPSGTPAGPSPSVAAAVPAKAPAITVPRPSPMIASVSFPRP